MSIKFTVPILFQPIHIQWEYTIRMIVLFLSILIKTRPVRSFIRVFRLSSIGNTRWRWRLLMLLLLWLLYFVVVGLLSLSRNNTLFVLILFISVIYRKRFVENFNRLCYRLSTANMIDVHFIHFCHAAEITATL